MILLYDAVGFLHFSIIAEKLKTPSKKAFLKKSKLLHSLIRFSITEDHRMPKQIHFMINQLKTNWISCFKYPVGNLGCRTWQKIVCCGTAVRCVRQITPSGPGGTQFFQTAGIDFFRGSSPAPRLKGSALVVFQRQTAGRATCEISCFPCNSALGQFISFSPDNGN